MKRLTAGVLLSVLGLCGSGCGGGGGGGGDDDNRLPLTRANAKAVAEEVSGAVDTLDRLAFMNHQLLDAVGGEGAGRVAASSGRAARVLARVPRLTALLGGEQTYPCGDSPASGTFTVAVTDVPPLDVLSAGDKVSVTYDRCAFEEVTTNGKIGFEVTNGGTGVFPSPPFALGLSFSFTGLKGTEGGQSTTVGGGFSMRVATQDGISFDTTLSGSELRVTEEGPENLSLALRDFQASTATDLDAYTIAVEKATLSVSGAGVDGPLNFRTSTPLSGAAGDRPDTGVVVVTGRNQSTLTMVVLNSEQVELRVDEDGNGAPDGAPIPVTWDELGGF